MSQNLYTYVGNNPINYIDPTGHSKEWIGKATKWIKEGAERASEWFIDKWDELEGASAETIMEEFTEDELALMESNVKLTSWLGDPNLKFTFESEEMQALINDPNHDATEIFYVMASMGQEKYIEEYGESFPLTLSTMTREIQMHYLGSFVLPNNEHLADADICTRDVEFWEYEENKWVDYVMFGYWSPFNWGRSD